MKLKMYSEDIKVLGINPIPNIEETLVDLRIILISIILEEKLF